MEPLNDDFSDLSFLARIEQEEVSFLLSHKVQILDRLQAQRDLKSLAAHAFRNLERSRDIGKQLDDINFALISSRIHEQSYGLDCSKCMITRFPKTLFTERLAAFWTRLEGLYLEHNHIAWLPEEMKCLINLRRINLSYNCLEEFPEVITTLLTLQFLVMRGNKLTAISSKICRLQELKLLHLDTNRIEHVPATIGMLQNVTELELSRNRIRSVPAELSRMAKLARLWLHLNPLEQLPNQITNKQGLFIALPEQPAPVALAQLPPPPLLQREYESVRPQEHERLVETETKSSGCTLL